MTRIPTPLALCFLLSTWTFAGCATGGFDAATDGLSAHLENVRLRENHTVEVDFVLTNHGDGYITLPGQGGSWGARQWTFRVRDARGREYELGNNQLGWYANGFWPFTIKDGERDVMRCRLDPSSNLHADGDVRVFTVVRRTPSRNDWVFPLSVTGYFTGFPENEPLGSNWSGQIWTQTVTVPPPPDYDPDAARFPPPHRTY